jgi:flagellar motor switch protein FliN/FliY
MIDPQILAHYTDQAAERFADFLGTLLGKETHVTTEPAATVSPADVASEAATRFTVLSKSSGDAGFAVQLTPEWLAPFSKAMLGVELSPSDADAADFFVEFASQSFGSIRNVLGGSIQIPEVYFDAFGPGAALPEGRLSDALVCIGFTAQTEAALLVGSLVLSNTVLSALPEPPSVKEADAMPGPSTASPKPIDVAQAAFPDLGRERIVHESSNGNFQMLAEVELNVTVELGRRNITLSDVLRLTTGSVIELEKLVGEPLEIYANGRLIAEGEAVVIDEQFGVRVTNLAASRQRAGTFM